MPAQWPDKSLVKHVINGTNIDLVPLISEQHADALFALFSDDETWRYLRDGPFDKVSLYREHLETFLSKTAFASFIIVQKDSKTILGKLSLLHPDPKRSSLEIGYVVFGAAAKGKPIGKEALAVLIDAVFDRFGCQLCEWRCDVGNIASARLAGKFHFVCSETRINHMIVKGVSRDTHFFELKRDVWMSNRQKIPPMRPMPVKQNR